MSSGSYSGLAKHDAVHRYWKELRIAPKVTSSGKAEQYVMPSVIVQLRGLPNSSVVVWNVCSSAEWRWNCPVVGQFEFTTLWVERFSPRMVSG